MRISLWIGVCHEFHSARGPWVSPEQALLECKKLTKNSKSGCVYIPVILKTEGQIVGDKTMLEEQSTVKPKKTSDRYVGQYL